MRMNMANAMTVAIASYAAVALGANGQATSATAPPAERAYIARLQPLNAKVAGSATSGTARFTLRGDALTIEVDVRNAPPHIEHLQHLHGFVDGKDATCATTQADTNHDGVVDVVETEPMSGTTMVPLTANPVDMKIAVDTYPKADAEGAYHYTKTVSLSALDKAFAEKFDGQPLDLDKRVVYIHTVSPDTQLPPTVATLDHIPAQVTLPIACGKIEAVR